MRRNVHVKTIWKRHKNPRTLEELQAVQREVMWTRERYTLANDRWIHAAKKTWCADWTYVTSLTSSTKTVSQTRTCIDEVTGVTLLRDCVAKARMEEMKWYEKFQNL